MFHRFVIVVVMRVIQTFKIRMQRISISVDRANVQSPSFSKTFFFTRETRDPHEYRTTSFSAIRWCSKDFPVLCSVRLSLWSRMGRPPANESQRSEQIVVWHALLHAINSFNLGWCHSHTRYAHARTDIISRCAIDKEEKGETVWNVCFDVSFNGRSFD